MNLFLDASVRAINRHGSLLGYSVVTPGVYDVETGTVSQVKTNYNIKIYTKHIQANSYNFPDLIGKQSCMFYLANNNLGFVPKIGDEIAHGTSVYNIVSYQEHVAQGQIVLYRVIGVKG